ncbi:AAA domain containing protein [uncultured Caudovirales phage]|uniref:AAA domain containing protein n=1 Tax=uncultured Caudovirales phage TaxID=2100421 RepID=A0A6J5RPM6_9CAUD|nr:AAA domain containing protein [uncultured Caudovirales phage]CAB4212396.1 AAA domain containing protein [uncultured Caudovirales phage]
MREQLIAALQPLVSRLSHAMYWRKGTDGPRRIPEPFTPQRLTEHVTGNAVYGLCPIQPGTSTTRVALLDLDSHKGETSWVGMTTCAVNMLNLLDQSGLVGIPWRSSGGKGIHIYIVWDEPQDSYSVRQLLVSVLGLAGFTNGTKGVKHNQIEVFPKQDSVPASGCGNMAILPLAGLSAPLLGDHLQTVGARAAVRPEMWVPSAPVPFLEKPVRVYTQADPAKFEELQRALSTIRNSDDDELDYDGWFRMICSIHHGTDGSDDGLALAHEFSMRSSKYDPDFLDNRVWPYIKSDRDGAVITSRTLFNAAQATGLWTDPEVLNAFEDCTPTEDEIAADPTVAPAPVKPVKGSRFPTIPAHQFILGKQPKWIIKGILPQGELGVIFGESASGKSFLALDMLGAILQGIDWRGHKVPTACNCVYIAAEGAYGAKNRIKAYAQHHGVELETLGLGVIAGAPNFMEVEDINDVMHSIRAFGPVAVIVVDTYAQVTPGANENSGEDMGKAIGHCKSIHRATGAIVLLVHHAGKDSTKGARGWSGLRAAADFEMEITRDGHDRMARLTKLKDGEDGAEMPFKLTVVGLGDDEDGEPITSCAVIHEEPNAASSGPREPRGEVARLVWREFHDLASFGDGSVPVAMLFDVAKGKLPAPAAGRDTRVQHVRRALLTLVDTGWVTVENESVTSKRVVL